MKATRMLQLSALPIVWLLAAAPSEVQGCGFCVTRSDFIWALEQHAFGARSGVSMDCVKFNSCHNDWQALDCFERHFACALAMDEREAEAVLAAAEAGDAAVLERIRAEHPNAVVYNRERSALQVLGCTGEVIAHVPVAGTSALAD